MSEAPARPAPAAHEPNIPLNSLTSLRFFAALAVVFYHSGAGFASNSRAIPKFVENALNNGWLGVPFFFILSGFILAYVYKNARFDGVTLARFFIARFSRLYPVYLLALLLSIPFVERFSPALDWPQFLLLQKWWPGSGATDWNFVAWTLSVELFFYCLFPFALPFLRGLSNARLALCLGLVVALLGLIWLGMTPELGDGALKAFGAKWPLPVPLLRTPEFLYGVILGLMFTRGMIPRSPMAAFACLAVIALAACASTSTLSQTVALLAFGPLIATMATSAKGDALRRVLDHPLLVLLGGASYSLYLLQFPLRKLVPLLVPARFELYGRLAFAPLLIGVSVAVYLWFEGPMRERLRVALDPSKAG